MPRLLFLLLFIGLVQCKAAEKEDTKEAPSEDKMSGHTEEELNELVQNGLVKMLEKFDIKSIKRLRGEAYQLFYHSSFGVGRTIKFEKKSENVLLTSKCLTHDFSNYECEESTFTVSLDEWSKLEELIQEFDFWTEPKIRINFHVLDGYSFLLEGKDRKYRLLARGSPRDDKIGSLCEKLQSYYDHLEINNNK